MSYMFYSCSSLKSLPDISKWNTENINNLNSIFENCSLLNFIPISKWKLNDEIKINNIFKGCNSLLIIPDISKWKINNIKCINISSFNSTSITLKEVKSNSLSTENNKDYSYEDYSSLKNNDNTNLSENINSIDFSNNTEDLDDYYDNFYN